jgi:hypothetical protein
MKVTKVQKEFRKAQKTYGEKPFFVGLDVVAGISHYYVSLAVKCAEINFRFHSLRRFLCCCEVGVLHLSNKQVQNPYKINKTPKNPSRKNYLLTLKGTRLLLPPPSGKVKKIGKRKVQKETLLISVRSSFNKDPCIFSVPRKKNSLGKNRW